MNNKNNLKFPYTLMCLFMFIFFTIPCASFAIFNPTCNTNTINGENIDKPITISVFYDGKSTLPEEFNFTIIFDNDVFKKSAKIDYNSEIFRNYKHNKNIFGNEISVRCSLKPTKYVPEIPKKEALFSLTMECKKSISKSETELKIIAEGDFKKETVTLPIKIKTECQNIFVPLLSNLIPNCGNLNPPFSPDINEYSVCVPNDTKDITFECETDDTCSAKVNRHKLQSPGSDTDIYITVKPNQKGTNNIYHISVKREVAPEKSPHTNTKEAKSTENKKSHKSRSKIKSGSSLKHKKYDCPEEYLETEEKSPETKDIELKNSENPIQDNQKIYSIIVLSSIIVILLAIVFINRKKIFDSKISLNKTSKK